VASVEQLTAVADKTDAQIPQVLNCQALTLANIVIIQAKRPVQADPFFGNDRFGIMNAMA